MCDYMIRLDMCLCAYVSPSISLCVCVLASLFCIMAVILLLCAQVVFHLQLTLSMKGIRAPTASPPSLPQCCPLVATRTGGSYLLCVTFCLLLPSASHKHRYQVTVKCQTVSVKSKNRAAGLTLVLMHTLLFSCTLFVRSSTC